MAWRHYNTYHKAIEEKKMTSTHLEINGDEATITITCNVDEPLDKRVYHLLSLEHLAMLDKANSNKKIDAALKAVSKGWNLTAEFKTILDYAERKRAEE